MQGKYCSLLLALLFLAAGTFSQESSHPPHVTIKELPPEPFPHGTCTDDLSGYLAITKNGKAQTDLDNRQLGEYIRVRLSQGYSVALYPQISGKIFAIATCESSKH